MHESIQDWHLRIMVEVDIVKAEIEAMKAANEETKLMGGKRLKYDEKDFMNGVAQLTALHRQLYG